MEYTYDTYGNLKTKKSYHGSSQDAVGFTYSYNVDGNLAAVAYDGYTKSYTYPDYTQNELVSLAKISKSGQDKLIIRSVYNKYTGLYTGGAYLMNDSSRLLSVNYKDQMRGILSGQKDGPFDSTFVYRDDYLPTFQRVSLWPSSYTRYYQRKTNY